MPTYEYVCRKCGANMDIFQSIKENPRRKCPKCGTLSLQRLVGIGGGILFKGSGFYETDYRSESYKRAEKKEKEPAKKKKDTKKNSVKKTESPKKATKKIENG